MTDDHIDLPDHPGVEVTWHDRLLPGARVTTLGYWRLGEANHPDHDYGED